MSIVQMSATTSASIDPVAMYGRTPRFTKSGLRIRKLYGSAEPSYTT